LERLRALGLLKPRGRQRTDSTHVLAAIRVLNRLERGGESLRAALNSLAVVTPAWLQAVTPPAWYDRDDGQVENYHLPTTDAARKALATVIGTDGRTRLDAIEAATEHRWLREIPAVQILRQVWAEQYIDVDDTLVWRDVQEMPSPAELIASPL
jgi:transposase